MEHLGKLLAAIPLAEPDEKPAATAGSESSQCGVLEELGADLPSGHLHVWGGPAGAGKKSFLLSLLHGAAARRRPVVYATYDLPASSLARRLLAMTSGVDVAALPAAGVEAVPVLTPEASQRVCCARRALSQLPFWFQHARGFTVAALADRLVRAPARPAVLVVDYLQAVIRERGRDLGQTLRGLSDVATQFHVAVVCAVRADSTAQAVASTANAAGLAKAVADAYGLDVGDTGVADRLGWIAPTDASGARRADVLQNRYGNRTTVPLHLDEATGRLGRVVPEAGAQPTPGNAP